MTRTRVRWPAVVLVSLALSAGFLAGRASGGALPDRTAVRTYVVQPGDTLWEIARAEVGETGDPRPMVHRIADLNGLRGAAIDPGDALVLPAAS